MTKNLKRAILLSVIIMVYLAFTHDTADTGAMRLGADVLLSGEDVYSNPEVYLSSPPLHLHLLASLRYLSIISGISFQGIWKLPAIASHVGITIFIFQILQKFYHQTKEKASQLSIWYALNPITLLVSGFHGQSEEVWILFVFIAWYLLKFKKKSGLLFSSLLMAIAVSYKMPALLLLPALFIEIPDWKNRFKFLSSLSLFGLFTFSPELFSSTSGLFEQVITYDSTLSVWGITSLISKIYQPNYAQILIAQMTTRLKLMILIGSIFVTFGNWISKYSDQLPINIKITRYIPRWVKEKDFFQINLWVILLFLIFSPGFGVQYLIWVLPFLVITQNKYAKLYTIFTMFAYLHTYGLAIDSLRSVLTYLQVNIYYKTKMLYPYDLYFPTWFLMIKMWIECSRDKDLAQSK